MGAYSPRCAANLLGWEVQFPARSRLCVKVRVHPSGAVRPAALQTGTGRAGCPCPAAAAVTPASGLLLRSSTRPPACCCQHTRALCLQGGPAAKGLSTVAALLGQRVVAAGADRFCTEPFKLAYAPYAVSARMLALSSAEARLAALCGE